jgi:perosamine synthetase
LREIKDQGRPKRGTGGADTHVSVGFNFKFTNLQAAVGIGQLELFPSRRLRMREIYRRYISNLRDVENVRIFGFAERELPLWIDALCGARDQLDAHLQKHNIHGRRFWHAMHTQAPYRRTDAQFPVSSTAARHAFWLPSSFLMSDDEIDRVCESIRSFYVARGRGRTTAEAA